ncbi:MAG: enoyl-[acyl-carrier-protein] reductase FabI [Euryarchaeota archaeon]|jgi:enoyl-[acyl-carrier protein] reductase I|nr:enoyl-[acyl-carrier-protein] reductase FabI [Euryarchaeota archaeon]|tara:strand:+ start:548 stop:1342 length:795 start_codon:yes stop_codon:yes gene_type:complete
MLKLQGKTAFVFGVASEDSIAWAICQQLAAAGVTLYLGYQKRFMSRIFQLKDKLPQIGGFYPLDVEQDATTREFFEAFEKDHPGKKADILIHAIGFAPRSCFDRPILFVEDSDINTAMTISANSLQRCLKHALPYLNPGSSTVTLTYAASNRFVPNYGIMSMAKAALECWTRELACHLGPEGHRVNAISSGPIRTIAASGVPGFDNILDHVEANSPLRRNVNQEDVAGATLWLASPLSSGVTGQCIYVDGGYSITMVPQSIMNE